MMYKVYDRFAERTIGFYTTLDEAIEIAKKVTSRCAVVYPSTEEEYKFFEASVE